MSYENAVPKPLKFLISDGKMVDEDGNVIAESETLKDLYTKWAPEVKKYLLSDGSVVDEEGNLIIKNEYYKNMYDQAIPKVAKYLHSDGTVDENPGGGSSNLEDNKEVTVDVSAYTEPVEVTPTQGKNGMKKVTVTLSNIPSGGQTLYIWSFEEGSSSAILPVGSFNELTVGMKGIGCSAASEYMYAGEIKSIDVDSGEAIFENENGSYSVTLADYTNVTEFPNLEG